MGLRLLQADEQTQHLHEFSIDLFIIITQLQLPVVEWLSEPDVSVLERERRFALLLY